jgi:hypothetical protein
MIRWHEMKLVVLLIVLASPLAHADTPLGRIGATFGYQQTDRSAWVFGPSLEVAINREWSIRGETHIEFGDFDDPFGESNFRGGSGPHVNHVMFGPTWRPERFAAYQLATGAQAGVHIMHSTFAENHFSKGPALGLFVQAGRKLGPISLALQFRLDVSATVDMAGPEGDDVTTTSARFNLAFEVPVSR